MKQNKFHHLLASERGNVSVDWTLYASLGLAIGAALIASSKPAVQQSGTELQSDLWTNYDEEIVDNGGSTGGSTGGGVTIIALLGDEDDPAWTMPEDHFQTFSNQSPPTGWQADAHPNEVGIYNLDDPYFPNEEILDGENVFFLDHENAVLSYTSDTIYNANATYQLSFITADASSWFGTTSDYTVEILAGNTVIGTVSGNTGDHGGPPSTLSSATLTSDVQDANLNGEMISFRISGATSGTELYVADFEFSMS